MAAKRIYLVTLTVGDKPVKHLVRATHPTHALKHVVDKFAKVDHASQDDLVNHVRDGIAVEDAGAG